MPDDAVQFGSLPPVFRGPGTLYVDVAEALKARPNEWAKIKTHSNAHCASEYAARVKRGVIVAFRPRGSFEATVRGADVWARYIGTRCPAVALAELEAALAL